MQPLRPASHVSTVRRNCERSVIDQRARLLSGRRKCTGDLAPRTSTWKRKKVEVKVQDEDVEDRETERQ